MNHTLAGKQGRFLKPRDRLRATDYVRELFERPMMSQDGGWDTTFRPDDWRGTFWHTANKELPAWVGKTYQEYLDFCSYNEPEHEIFRATT